MGKKGSGWIGAHKDDGPSWEDDVIRRTYTWSGAVTGDTIWQPSSGKKFVVTDYFIICGITSIVTVFDQTNNQNDCLINQASFAANGGISVTNLRTPFKASTINNRRNINISHQ